ncbi:MULTISPECIES: class Ia ribonucleoside-diphosphate reductase subunit beta [unclassified Colwellia]|jgi:ribonucleoside-diphosphate reductase beta chain|uniref:class Ia ribonucleoside-diphosphate reductase subunit beta n=1 Tax=unclassified Colwellia TaxID=196834 RepID=UPI0015F60DB7|nr:MULTISPECIES: class Ia ribonucleoside-diphosphate reductase subunit beta [unclassified Colwellia]MBA6363869.1 ribonucleotide-diphosphate reductase subunit beta [Colwellia sp. BRX8-8]MBA6337098.1 ribonucleotide-diphosphate reductase subunit beta [Colwellia sp. BRX8-7]MBA6349196.1 ribonucleotide-diphosphate reductase subunit beta [Colwellia sp. BRX8-9]MBA6353087.1 ribonucleotide-diphosphate reductase subunit beta [Colwellia sp. BRX9-1]MBA6356157.1 ribonucleotide-diphosphate reductase subunit 
MSYTTFNQVPNNALLEPMFLGNSVNVSRYDQQRFIAFEKLIEKQLSFFWRPEEIDVSKDRSDWQSLTPSEKHIFISNLKYQTLLDSMAARSVNAMFLPLVSLPEVETWIETWAFSETIHSRSYTHILRNLFSDPSEIFDDIVVNPAILKRASSISKYFDAVIITTQLLQSQGDGTYEVDGEMIEVSTRKLKERLYLAVCSVNALEAIRFYVSFACSFAFAERELLEGNAKIIKLIARDEALHLTGTQHILNNWLSGRDDPEMKIISQEMKEQGLQIFLDVVEQEKEWAQYLFKDGSMIGLNAAILNQYIEYISNQRLTAIGFDAPFDIKSNPLPWMNAYLVSDNVQVAPQETEISSYLVGQVDSSVSSDDFDGFDL